MRGASYLQRAVKKLAKRSERQGIPEAHFQAFEQPWSMTVLCARELLSGKSSGFDESVRANFFFPFNQILK
jgi:hypothetical protein